MFQLTIVNAKAQRFDLWMEPYAYGSQATIGLNAQGEPSTITYGDGETDMIKGVEFAVKNDAALSPDEQAALLLFYRSLVYQKEDT